MKKILVVDDERNICDFIQGFFGKRGFNVVCAFDGEEALALVEKEKPDIMLLDVMMPKLNGLETLKRIKDKDPKQKIIMVTCVDDADKINEAKRLGATDYITKPLVLEELVKKIKELTSGK